MVDGSNGARCCAKKGVDEVGRGLRELAQVALVHLSQPELNLTETPHSAIVHESPRDKREPVDHPHAPTVDLPDPDSGSHDIPSIGSRTPPCKGDYDHLANGDVEVPHQIQESPGKLKRARVLNLNDGSTVCRIPACAGISAAAATILTPAGG